MTLLNTEIYFLCYLKAIGQVGKVVKIDEDGDVFVNYGLNQWAFHPEALSKVQ
jgi:hypothetical protein